MKIIEKRVDGFSLLELLVTIGIVAILAGIALPAMTELISSAKTSSAANDLYDAIKLARSEAVKRNLEVRVCTSNSGQTACDSSKNWEDGWLVLDSGNSIVSKYGALSGALTFRWKSGTAKEIVFAASGKTVNSGELILCKDTTIDNYTHTIKITVAGQIKLRDQSALVQSDCHT